MDIVYNYWHPKPAAIIDGFHFDLTHVFIGLKERQESGVEPNPYELARRIHPLFHQDLDNLENMLRQSKPPPEDFPSKPGT